MVDSKTLKIRIGTIIKNLGMLTFVPDHLKAKKMCKNALKKLPFVVKYVPDRYKTKKICDKGIIKTGEMLEFIPDCYKDQKLGDKAAANILMH